MLTIFSIPKPFDGHIGMIQENAIGSWTRLHPDVQVLLLGDESGIRHAAKRFEVRHLGGVRTNEWGTPVLDSAFERACKAADFPYMCYVNADIILMPDLLSALNSASHQFQQFLIVGQRWDLQVRGPINFINGWQDSLVESVHRQGTLHPPAGSDYFVFSRDQFRGLPPFAVGRAGWDNWMIFAARASGAPVVNASAMVTAIHQNHEYEHLQGGQPHHALPESQRNVALAGGRETMFTLRDSTLRFDKSGLSPIRPRDVGISRWLEATAIAKLGPGSPARLIRMLMHPVDSLTYFWGRIRRLLGSREPILS